MVSGLLLIHHLSAPDRAFALRCGTGAGTFFVNWRNITLASRGRRRALQEAGASLPGSGMQLLTLA